MWWFICRLPLGVLATVNMREYVTRGTQAETLFTDQASPNTVINSPSTSIERTNHTLLLIHMSCENNKTARSLILQIVAFETVSFYKILSQHL